MKWKRGKRVRKPSRKAKVSKPLKKAIKQVMSRQVETKTINVPDPDSLVPQNTVSKAYTALQGIQYLAVDVFKVKQGGQNTTDLGSSFNRIGDKVQARGFLLDYMFHMRRSYSIGAQVFTIPFIKLRVLVFRMAYGFAAPATALIYDSNFLISNTSVLQPVNWDEGYIKEVLMDKTYVIRATESISTNTTYTNCLHLKKYIPYKKLIRYADNNTSNPNGSDKPIYVAISAEVDDSLSGLVPSGATLFNTTGYCRAWFKDA